MPLYVFYGEEEYLRNRAVKALRQQVVPADMGALSHKILKKPKIHTCTEAVGATSLNLLGGMLIEIHDFEPLQKAVSDPGELAMLENLKSLLSDLPETRHVTFVSSKIDRKVKFAKWITSQKTAHQQNFAKFAFWETGKAAAALQGIAKDNDIALTPTAAERLVEAYGVELQPLVNEVEKLSVYTIKDGKSRPITPEDVAALSNHNDNTFEMLADWIRGENRATSFYILEELLLRQHPVQLFALTQTYLNNIFQLRFWQQLGMTQAVMADRLKKHPFKIQKDLEAFRNVPFERLAILKRQTLDYEWKAKTGQLPSTLAFEMLMGA